MKRPANIAKSSRGRTERHAADATKLPLPGLLFCFFLSGAAGLIYQVAWTKSLGLLFGYTAYATATVLAVFMGGLAFGSAWLGKYGDQHSNPIALYGWIELGVAGSGALSLTGLAAVRAIYLSAYPAFAGSRWSLLALRFAGAAMVLLLPTFLMGGTLPILIRGVTRRFSDLGVRMGSFYAVNTLGAVGGTLAAGFLFLPSLGLRLTVATAVLLNVVAGLFALQLARRADPSRANDVENTTSKKATGKDSTPFPLPASSSFVLISFALVGATAIAYEIGWTRLLATVLGSSTYAFTLMLATVLLGSVMGSFLFERWFKRTHAVSLVTFARTQLATAIAALFFLLFFQHLPELVPPILRATHGSFVGLILTQFVTSALAMLPVAIVFGFNFPAVVVLIAGAPGESGQLAAAVGRAYAANTCGAIFAAVITGFLLLPWIGSYRVIALTAALNLFLAVALQLRVVPRRFRSVAIYAGVLAALFFVGFSLRFFSRSLAAFGTVLYGNYHEHRLTAREMADCEDVVFFEDGVNATIAVTRSDDYVALKTNGKVDASNLDSSTQLLLGDLGAVFHDRPRRVLIIGLGGGMTASAVSRFPDVEWMDCVEIEPAVLHAAPYLERLNRGVLQDPRFHLISDDARNFLQTAREPYDLIISEPSNPWIAGIAALYTNEFYATVRQHLAPGGIFVQWVQAYALQPDDFRMILATLAPHFPDVSLWHSAGRDFLLLARQSTNPLTFDRSRALWLHPKLQEDFHALHLTQPESWPVYFRLSDSRIRALAAGATINTDDRTLLEYRASQALLNENLTDTLDRVITQSEQGLFPPELTPRESPATIQAVTEAALELNSPRASSYAQLLETVSPTVATEILRGREALRVNRVPEAMNHFEAAQRLSANLYNVQYWLGVAEHRVGLTTQAEALIDVVIKHQPHNLDAIRLRIDFARDRHDWSKATQLQLNLVTADASAAEYCGLGDLYLRAGNLQAADKPLRDGLQRDFYSFLCRRDLGELERATGRTSEAQENLEFVIRYFPEADAKAYVSLALVYRSEGQLVKAKEILRKGRRLLPGDPLLQRFALP